jgi:imidazolonepropionase-like amidohydrolase
VIRRWRTRSLFLAAASVLALSAVLSAQEKESGGDSAGSDAAKKDEKAGKVEDRWYAVVGGEVHTGTGAVLRGATVLAKNGKITAIGYDLDIPPEAKKLDATGLVVYPGIVATSTQGVVGLSGSDLEDTIDPFNPRLILGLASGITTSGVAGTAVKLRRFSVKEPVVREKLYATLSWSDRNPSGKRSLRDKFQKAADYLRQFREWEEKVKKDKDLKEPAKKDVDSSVLGVLKGEAMAKFTANDRDDILGIARLAQEYGFRPVVEGCTEGWTVAGELGRAGAYAIVTPRERRAKDEQLVAEAGSNIKNAAILHQAGVQVAVIPATEGVDLGGLVGRDIMAIAIEADFAVRGGLSEDAALASITIVPARIMGIAHRVGTLEVGKDCDLIVTDGDLLHYKTFVQYTVIDGKLVYDKEKELFFAHIRPRAPAAPAEKKIDKGETPAAPAEAKPKEGEKEEGSKDEPKKKDEKEEKKDG